MSDRIPTVELGSLATLLRNGIFAQRPTDDASGTPILRISAVRDGALDLRQSKFVDGISLDQLQKFSVHPGDLLLTRYNGSRDLVGTSAVVPVHGGPLLHPDKLIRVVLDEKRADPKFVNYQLQTPGVRRFLEPRIRTTAGQSGIAGADVRAIPIALPSLSRQRRIVEVLEDNFSRLDAARKDIAAAGRKSSALATSRLWAVTHLGSQTIPLADVAEVKLGRQRSPKNHQGDQMVPYLRAANVDWNRLLLADVKSMNFTDVERRKFELQAGDILLTEASGSAAEVGKSALYTGTPSDICFQNTVLRVRAHGANPEFLQKLLLAEARAGRFRAHARGVGIHHLGRSRLAAWPVQLPEAEDQVVAARLASEALAESDQLSRRLEDVSRRGAALRTALLDAAFSGYLTGHASDLDRAEEVVTAVAEVGK